MSESRAKILVVEDEESIRRFITLNLNVAGFQVGEASSGEDALGLLKSFVPKVVVLDIMLPGINGLEVCQHIRKFAPETIVIMLTAKGQDTDKILGLDFGADDYMVKPFNPLELIARIKAILRRTANLKNTKQVIDDLNLRLDLGANKFFKNAAEIQRRRPNFPCSKL